MHDGGHQQRNLADRSSYMHASRRQVCLQYLFPACLHSLLSHALIPVPDQIMPEVGYRKRSVCNQKICPPELISAFQMRSTCHDRSVLGCRRNLLTQPGLPLPRACEHKQGPLQKKELNIKGVAFKGRPCRSCLLVVTCEICLRWGSHPLGHWSLPWHLQ